MTQLKDVSKIVTGSTPSRSDPSNYGGTIPWVKPSDLDKSDPVLTSDEYLSEKGAAKSRLIHKDSVIVSCIGNLGKLGYAGCEMATNQQINSIIFNNKLVFSRYGYHYVKTIKSWMEENASSTTIQILNKSRFEGAPFYYPSLAEQHRIVERLELLLGKINKANERLEKIPAILKCFRQSVLSSACSGKLTAEWREENECGEWKRGSVASVCRSIVDGDHQPPPQTKSGIPFLVISNITSGSLDFTNTRFVSEDYFNSLSDKRIAKKGDVLYSIVGSYGIPVLVDTEDKFCFQRHIALFKPREINGSYLLYVLKSLEFYNKATEIATGTAQLTVPIKGLREIEIPIPLLTEQEEIICQVDKLFALADKIEQRYKNAKVQLERAEKAIYAKAFKGELIKPVKED